MSEDESRKSAGQSRRRGAPVKEVTADATVTLRVPMAEKAAMVRAANREGVKLSAWCREVLGRASKTKRTSA